jgi:hypothetical protein
VVAELAVVVGVGLFGEEVGFAAGEEDGDVGLAEEDGADCRGDDADYGENVVDPAPAEAGDYRAAEERAQGRS